jgi:hypothetical protein
MPVMLEYLQVCGDVVRHVERIVLGKMARRRRSSVWVSVIQGCDAHVFEIKALETYTYFVLPPSIGVIRR